MAGARIEPSGTRFFNGAKNRKKNSGISAWSHLRWTALDHHEASFADATGLHGDGRRRTSIGSLELLNIIMV